MKDKEDRKAYRDNNRAKYLHPLLPPPLGLAAMEGRMSVETRNLIGLVVALLATAVSFSIYVMGGPESGPHALSLGGAHVLRLWRGGRFVAREDLMMGGQLRRLILDFCTGEIVVRALYKNTGRPRAKHPATLPPGGGVSYEPMCRY